jgi:hypothetical protein
MKVLRYVLVGAVVLAATIAVWWLLSLALGALMGPKTAILVALGVIVVTGWAANGLLLWRQAKRGREDRR